MRGATFLDVGCGYGRNLIIFQKLGFDVTGLDLARELVDFVRAQLGVKAVCSSLESFVPGQTFDCILASHVIEHVTDLHGFMAGLVALLSDGGLLILETPLSDDRGLDGDRFRDIYHTLFFDHFTLGMLGRMHGLVWRDSATLTFRKPGDDVNHAVIQVSYLKTEDPENIEWDRAEVQALRAAYESLRSDFLKMARRQLEWQHAGIGTSVLKRLVENGFNYLHEYGIRATVKQTAFLLWDYYRQTRKRKHK